MFRTCTHTNIMRRRLKIRGRACIRVPGDFASKGLSHKAVHKRFLEDILEVFHRVPTTFIRKNTKFWARNRF